MSDLYCDDCGTRLRWTINPGLGGEHTYCPDCHPERGPKELFEVLEETAYLVGDVGEAPYESFSVMCPRCGETICQLTTPEVTGFEAVCPGCEAELFLYGAVALPDHYDEWAPAGNSLSTGEDLHDAVDADVLGHLARALWHAKAREGTHQEGVLKAQAEELGWDWKPPEQTRGRPPEDVLEDWE